MDETLQICQRRILPTMICHHNHHHHHHHHHQIMDLPLVSRSRNPSSFLSSSFSASTATPNFKFLYLLPKKSRLSDGRKLSIPFSVRASAERSSEGMEGARSNERPRFGAGTAMEVSTFDRTFAEAEFPLWEKLGAIVRLCYGIGIYGAMALVGKFICSISGVDCMGGFHPSLDAILVGLGYAAPPIMALLFILDDEVVKLSPHARAIRDVEDEELRSFFYGMSPWQFILIVTASSIGEELFYRVAVQGALTDMFLRGTEFVKDTHGIASLSGMLPLFVPFAQAFAAVITAALTGSLYYVAASPKDPTYVVAPVLQSRSGREDLKKLFAAWYERRQLKKIYSPLLEGLLALYLGFEWIQTDNILAPMITHGIYSGVVLGHGLWKIHDHRRRLRQRIQQVRVESRNSSKL